MNSKESIIQSLSEVNSEIENNNDFILASSGYIYEVVINKNDLSKEQKTELIELINEWYEKLKDKKSKDLIEQKEDLEKKLKILL